MDENLLKTRHSKAKRCKERNGIQIKDEWSKKPNQSEYLISNEYFIKYKRWWNKVPVPCFVKRAQKHTKLLFFVKLNKRYHFIFSMNFLQRKYTQRLPSHISDCSTKKKTKIQNVYITMLGQRILLFLLILFIDEDEDA